MHQYTYKYNCPQNYIIIIEDKHSHMHSQTHPFIPCAFLKLLSSCAVVRDDPAFAICKARTKSRGYMMAATQKLAANIDEISLHLVFDLGAVVLGLVELALVLQALQFISSF